MYIRHLIQLWKVIFLSFCFPNTIWIIEILNIIIPVLFYLAVKSVLRAGFRGYLLVIVLCAR